MLVGRECDRLVWWDRYITVGKVWCMQVCSECDMLVWNVWDMMMRDADMLVRKEWTCWWGGYTRCWEGGHADERVEMVVGLCVMLVLGGGHFDRAWETCCLREDVPCWR